MRSAIVHDWLISGVGGGEKVLEAIHRLFPSKIHTLVRSMEGLKGTYFENLEIESSFIQRLPRAEKKYKSYLPFFPLAIEHFDLTSYDLIISSSHCAAKGVITTPDQVHICYCHTPMRYAWDLTHEYLRESKLDRGVKGFFAKLILHYLRGWDVHSAHRVDHFIANSQYVAKRIEKFYHRKAEVIYPPVDLQFFREESKKDDYYLTASRMVPYKRVDLIVEAFAKMPEKKLVVIGDGPEWKKVKEKAGKNVELMGYQSDDVLKAHMQKAKGFVFAAVEDFGIVPVEAMASGTPVIAFAKGGVKETVVDRETGLLYSEQSVSGIIEAIQSFERMAFDSKKCRNKAEEFSVERFNQSFLKFVSSCTR
ncbi:MAG: glycosyltransferase family 4 protein [Parachlamydiales bacterium]|nr:glycosyltransferase family 4 protein [Parachlamydiales bacterium]